MSFDPRLTSFSDAPSEELYPAVDATLSLSDWLLFIVRLLSLLACVLGVALSLGLLLMGGCRRRLKSWPLYLVVSSLVLIWLTLSIIQDHADEYWLHVLYRYPQRQSLVWGARHLLQGLALYLALLLLGHLSHLQHRGSWLYLVGCVVLVPLLYTMLVLVLDLRLMPESRQSWQWNVALGLLKTLAFNVATSGLILFFSPRFCSSRLSGSYTSRRSSLPLLLTRLTSTLILLHNTVSVASFVCTMLASLPLSLEDGTLTHLLLGHRVLEELALLLIALALPMALPICVLALRLCCRGQEESESKMEMDPIEKIYTEMWSTNGNEPRKGRMGSVSGSMELESGSATGSLDSISRRVDKDPNGFAAKRRNRQSYMEAVSMGSLDQEQMSVTSEPIDL